MSDPFGARLVEQIPALQRYARCLVRTADQQDDLVQETVKRALERQDTYVDERSLTGWLFTIMRNAVISQHRRGQLAARRRPDLDGTVFAERAQHAPQLAAVELREVAAVALEHLSETEIATLLAAAQEADQQELARAWGVADPTVRSRLNRMREVLRVLLEQPAGSRRRRPLLEVRRRSAIRRAA